MRILILAPFGRNAQLLAATLRQDGIAGEICADMAALLQKLKEATTAAIIVTDDCLNDAAWHQLSTGLSQQPIWSNLPLAVLADREIGALRLQRIRQTIARRQNSIVLERPLAKAALLSIVRVMLEWRCSQLKVHDLVQRQQNFNRQLEQRVKERTQELHRSNEDLERFAYISSHDLQEPLRMVATFVGLLQRNYADKLDATANEFIDFAVEGSKRMSQLIEDLLTYSRIHQRAHIMQAINVDAIVSTARANLAVQLCESTAVLEIAPLPTVQGDVSQLLQVFQNLIGNAIKYRSRNQAPHIEIGASRTDEQWLFYVRDNGIGIDPCYSEKIFLPFTRLHSRRCYPEGTGIGLAVVKRVIERHGGRIWIESVPGTGSTFFFTLPAAAAAAEEDAATTEAA